MEKLSPIELGKGALAAALHAGQFVVEHLVGGGWADLPHPEPRPATPPVRANITYHRS